MLKGRLGLETARIPHKDRHGLLWLSRGVLSVEDGTLRFVTGGTPDMDAGDYAIPFQGVSMIVMGPGSTISHDALRLLARHGTALVAAGDDGVRCYSAMPFGPDDSAMARRQARAWADEEVRTMIARRMYAWRLGEVLPHRDISVLRGIEGARMKETYRLLAAKYGVTWQGRRYDRADPHAADPANQAINHASTAVEGAAMIAVATTATLPQLGFIHEDSAISFILDIADLFRDSVTLPVAFKAVRESERRPDISLERIVRRQAGRELKDAAVIDGMIGRIKELLDADDRGRHP